MPLQNRVDPFGQVHAVSARGTMFGNRGGCMHTDRQTLKNGRRWTNERWITCVLEFRGRNRKLMQPGRYTELFFLDEATAFAAGHRPCMECRRADANRFADLWWSANREPGTRRTTISEMDRQLHDERIDPATRRQRTHATQLAGLPDGAMVALPGTPGTPLLVAGGKLHPWTFEGYGPPLATPAGSAVLLTPPSVVRAFEAGYRPAIHPSLR